MNTIESALASTRTCADCKHFLPAEADPLKIGAPRRGECRHSPPLMVVLPMHGGMAIHTQYPQVEQGFPACGQHEVAMAFAQG